MKKLLLSTAVALTALQAWAVSSQERGPVELSVYTVRIGSKYKTCEAFAILNRRNIFLNTMHPLDVHRLKRAEPHYVGIIRYKAPLKPHESECDIIRMTKLMAHSEYTNACLTELLKKMQEDGCRSVNVVTENNKWHSELENAGFKQSFGWRNWFARIGLVKAHDSFTYTFKK